MISVYLLLDWYLCHIWAMKKMNVAIRNHLKQGNNPRQAAFSISSRLITLSSKNGYVQFE